MWPPEVIERLNREAAKRARIRQIEPARWENPEVPFSETPPTIPDLGDACADWDARFKRVDTLFMDISGWGAEEEPSLTLDQFQTQMASLISLHGPCLLAIEERGQFQAYIAVWAEEATL